MHPFRFGLVLESIRDGRELRETVARAEAAGYATALIRDHLVAAPFGPQLAPLVALTAAAAHTRALRLGTMVFDNDFRHPALLAKEIATLDAISGGRVELGLGAGWLTEEYQRAGIAFDAPGKRIARLSESITVLKGLLSGEEVTFHGEHYQIDGLTSFPASVQRPHPPLLLGGGAPRMLALAGREADTVSVLTSSVASGTLRDSLEERSPERFRQKLRWIEEGAGRRFPSIELSLFPSLVITDDRAEGARLFAAKRGWDGVSVETIFAMPGVFIGSVAQIAESMRARREQFGFSYFVVGNDELDAVAPLVSLLTGC